MKPSTAILSAAALAIAMSAAAGDPPAAAPAPQQPAAAPAPEKPDPSMPVDAFLKQAAENDAVEVALGQLAMSNGAAQQVKDFGHRMAANQTAIQVLVAKAARKKEVALPGAMSPEAAADVERLRGLQGADFDHAYARLMSERARKALDMYRWQYENCQDPDVKAFVMGTTPLIASQQRLGEAMHQDINKDEIRAEAERKAAEAKAAEQKRAEDAAAQAAAAAGKKPAPKKPKKPMGTPG
jgi:putative membrane protein